MPIYDIEDALDNLIDALQSRGLVKGEDREMIKELVKGALDKKFGKEGTPADILTDPLGQKILLQLVIGAQMKLELNDHPELRLNFNDFAKDLLSAFTDVENDQDAKLKLEKTLDATLTLTVALTANHAEPMKDTLTAAVPDPKSDAALTTQITREAKQDMDEEFKELQLSLFRTLYGVSPTGVPLINYFQAGDSMGVAEQPGSRWTAATVSGIVAALDSITEKNHHAVALTEKLTEALDDFSPLALKLGKAAHGPSPSPMKRH